MRGFGVGASHASYHWWDRSANYAGSTRVKVRLRDTVRVRLRVKASVRISIGTEFESGLG